MKTLWNYWTPARKAAKPLLTPKISWGGLCLEIWVLLPELEAFSDWNAFQQSIQRYGAQIIPSLSDKIKEKVHNVYVAEADPKELRTWALFLSDLQKRDPILEIFTTNYDTILENSTTAAGINVHSGRREIGGRFKLDFSEWELLVTTPEDLLQSRSHGLLTKLHGSVDWQWGNNETINISDTSLNDPKKHPVLFPGYKGVPTKKPFSIFHRHLQKCISEEYEPLTAVVVVGFAFRDAYIGNIFRDNIRRTVPFFIIDLGKKLPSGIPPVQNPIMFSEGFTQETANACLKDIDELGPGPQLDRTPPPTGRTPLEDV